MRNFRKMGFEKESVGSNSIKTSCIENNQSQSPSPTPSPKKGSENLSSPQQSPQQEKSQSQNTFSTTTTRRSREHDTCYRCQKQGHWANECPDNVNISTTPEKPSEPCGAGTPGMDGGCLLCPCGAGTCLLLTSKTPKNPGRKFYCCPAANSDADCRFFKWFDAVRSDELVNVPMCKCGAAPCRVSTESTGPNAGRKFFVCPIKKGQGACSFFLGLDNTRLMTTNGHVDESLSSPQSTLTNCNDPSPANSDLVDEGDLSQQGMEMESPVVDTPQNPQSVSGWSKRGKLKLVDLGQESMSLEPLRKNCKRLRHGDPKIDGYVLDSAIECMDMPQAKPRGRLIEEGLRASVPTSDALIHCRQVAFWRQISIAGITLPVSSTPSYSSPSALSPLCTNSVSLRENCLVSAATNQYLDLRVQEWWGRLAFPPSQCLIFHAPKPFFCCVFPSFDRILAPQDVDIFVGEASADPPECPLAAVDTKLSPFSPVQYAQPSSVVCWGPLNLKSLLGMVGCNVMTDAISEGFAQLALQLQNKLLTLLESMDFHDQESMVREASITFAALEQLSFDCRPFCEQVKEFISHASSVAAIECSIRNNQSSQELVDRYNCQKTRLDHISHVHAEAVAELEASRERLRLLGEEASCVRDKLLQIETELSCFEVENRNLETQFVKINKDMAESEQSFQVASKAAEEALKLCQQREEERDAAKAAFKMARIFASTVIL